MNVLRLGFDIGSTTAKVAVIDSDNKIVHTQYRRHKAEIVEACNQIIAEIADKFPQDSFSISMTGSAAMGVSERAGLPFVQEVVAASEVVRKLYPEVTTLIDIGGEDGKIIFFQEGCQPDIRMNGSCAGGTGAFIDQMAGLIDVSVEDLNALVLQSKNIYPMASRCGVFAKTDVQNLISRKIPAEDIGASIFHAVALQTLNSLARGVDVTPKVMFCGGPLTFIPALRQAFERLLKLQNTDIVLPEHAELIPAVGAALHCDIQDAYSASELLAAVSSKDETISLRIHDRLKPLFQEGEFDTWLTERHIKKVVERELLPDENVDAYLGIDSGSTTTKIIILDSDDRVLFRFYKHNNGKPVETVMNGLSQFYEAVKKSNANVLVKQTAVTGYGEDLIRAAFSLDHGIVETIAHFMGAKKVDPQVSFILDIGGQDMKAIYVKDGYVNNLEINEACSSGCGSFIEGFAHNLNYTASDFATKACYATLPCDLGTRCTVFMNSKVKQALREGASIEDISAGLAYSVIKNCLYKVLKIKDMSELGDNIVVQGGTFRNKAVFRALEVETERKVSSSSMPELMGAYGAALYAKENTTEETSFIGFEQLDICLNTETKQLVCKACTNNCVVTRFRFSNNKTHYSGNKCEKVYSNSGVEIEKGANLYDIKYQLLFDKNTSQTEGKVMIGIPRILGMYANYAFWHELFTQSGINVVLSAESDMKLYEKGLGTVMADNICFPAKLAHGHVFDLVEKGVDRLFYPLVIYEGKEDDEAVNSFNCPIVSSYAEVLKSSIPESKRNNIPFDAPVISFKDKKLLKKACYRYLRSLGIKKQTFNKAFNSALDSQERFKQDLRNAGDSILKKAKEENRLVILLTGRPYHVDPLIHQKTSHILADLGVDVLTEDMVSVETGASIKDLFTISQWAYPNKILKAAQWTVHKESQVQFVHLNSFGCGPDSFIIDELKEYLQNYGKNYTMIRIDEITSTGSVRLRLRSLVESLKIQVQKSRNTDIQKNPIYTLRDKQKVIIGPHFSDFYSNMIKSVFTYLGYKFENLPKSDKTSVELGLKYANNEVCYPATLVIGDIIRAFKSGDYDPSETVVCISQTGGQCRASNYIALIKKSLLNAGYSDVPVISLASGNGLINEQPGFDIDWKKVLKTIVVGIMFGDAFMKMYYASLVREKVPGSADALKERYMKISAEAVLYNDVDKIWELYENAVRDFNELPVHDKEYPQIGIVGEIFLKYNEFANLHIADWLSKQGVEVRFPVLTDFMIQELVNVKVNKDNYLQKTGWLSMMYIGYLGRSVNKFIQKSDSIYRKYRFYRASHSIEKEAENASKIVDLANQFGEGWLIPAEIVTFADEGVNNVVSLQPFGCIANHIVAKGVEKKIKSYYPKMNLLFLDYDGGTSEVNIYNRLHFMVRNAREGMMDSVVTDHA